MIYLCGNQYTLVAQDYFTKWPFAFAMLDQKETRIVQLLKDYVFTPVGPPQHSTLIKGEILTESRILSDLCVQPLE